jgi:hypothetical protein
MEKGHKVVLAAVAVGFFALGAITLNVRQKTQVVEIPAPTPVVTVSPTSSPSATPKFRTSKTVVTVTTVPTKIGTPAAATKALR